jgi:DNA-binding NarL/FixJ family response regulator
LTSAAALGRIAAVTPLRVFVCDDSPALSALVHHWCDMEPEVEFAGKAGSAEQMLDQLEAARPDVLLLDYRLPEGDASPELVRRARELAPGLRVILLSALDPEELEVEAARIGADAHRPKYISIEDLLAVVSRPGS